MKCTNWEVYEKAEKKLFAADFFERVLVFISVVGCMAMAGYALAWFIRLALQTPILLAYAFIILIGIFSIVAMWSGARDRQKRRVEMIKRAKDAEESAIRWEKKLLEMTTNPPVNPTIAEAEEHKMAMEEARRQLEYYIDQMNFAMHDYHEHGGKKYE